MKQFEVITESMICEGNAYKVMRFTAETEAVKSFGERPWIAVHHSYTEADMPLTGMQMLISRDLEELNTRVRLDALSRNWKREHPDASVNELVLYLASVQV